MNRLKHERTKLLTKEEAAASRRWFLVDAEGKVLGRLSSALAKILIGKHKPTYTKNYDCGDFVVVINAEKVVVTGNKKREDGYLRYTGYPGGLKRKSIEEMLQIAPEKVIKYAVKRMLPKNNLGRRILSKLKVYGGSSHPHKAQKPQSIDPFLVAYGRPMK
ncbi:MAG: 50S ribosomal protein L13 [Planctomycetota bacterium]|nr:50S ribosomal protein L13 [Planctomycetota bacterium]